MSKLRNCKYKSVVKAATKFRPWDYGFILDMERAALEHMEKFIRTEGTHVNNLRDAQRIKILIEMINIIQDPLAIWNFPKEDSISKYVNIRNSKRFWEYSSLNLESPSFKCELRNRKAWYLYCKMREYWFKTFWD